MATDLSQFREVFFEEAADHLSSMEQSLLQLERSPTDTQLLHALFRAVHSIKGNAGMFGFESVVRFAHAFETRLDTARTAENALESWELDLFLKARDLLELLVAATRTAGKEPDGVQAVLEQLSASEHPATTPADAQEAVQVAKIVHSWQIRFEPAVDIFQTGMDPFLLIRDLATLGVIEHIELDTSRIPRWPDIDPERCYLAWTIQLSSEHGESEIRDIFAFVEEGAVIHVQARKASESLVPPSGTRAPSNNAPALIKAAIAPNHSDHASLRVSTSKVDKLVDLVGELVIAQSMAGQVLQGFELNRLGELLEAFANMERSTRDLQERIMAVRMIPIGGVFSRFNRVIRDLSAATGKQIRLELSGEEIELDKSVIEQLADPLTHLVRNSADHGLEPIDERRAAGKPDTGVIHLSALHEGGNVIVEVSDDGRGLNTEKIRRKAIERGLISADSTLSEDQVHNLIFQPGFSTASEVSDLSGRGVGMDVVRRNVEALSGSITLSSRQGKGLKFRVKLPLTLAILDGLLLRVGSEVYILPLVSILESIRPRRTDVRNLAHQGEIVVLRGKAVPLIRIHKLFGVPDAIEDPSCAAAVIVDNDGQRVALLVDELLGQQQVVIKNLETNFRKVEGVMGATILGDGRTALILDVAGVLQFGRPARDMSTRLDFDLVDRETQQCR